MDKVCVLNGVEFQWNEEKYALNLRKHGVTFEEAAQVFFDEENIFGDASSNSEFRDTAQVSRLAAICCSRCS